MPEIKRMPTQPQRLQAYLNQRFVCECGKEHYAPLKAVSIRPGALSDFPAYIREFGFQKPYLICDSVTFEVAGRRCMEILKLQHIQATLRVLSHIGFDEATVGELLIHMPMDCDLCVAVGTGAVNDITRFLSFRMGLPFMTVATAAPMDGFASSVAALNVDHFKTTFEAQPPIAIIGDTDILQHAPERMIAAGLGDLLGKTTCLCDWKIAHLIIQEDYCNNIATLVETCTRHVLKIARHARDRDPVVLGKIMEGLVLAGVAMSLYGNSRPASGCEHHISHYWEMRFEQRGMPAVPHGIQVGIGTVLILKLTEALRRTPVDFNTARNAARAYRQKALEKQIHAAYGPAAAGIIDLENRVQKNATDARLRRIDTMETHWEDILKLLDALPSSLEIITLLRSLNAPCLPQEIGVDRTMLYQTLLYCKEVRPRYTILQMLWDLELLEHLSDLTIQEIESDTHKQAEEVSDPTGL